MVTNAITDAMLEAAIDDLGDQFDSHDVIRKVSSLNQRDYIAELHAQTSNTPFQSVHARIGKRILIIAKTKNFDDAEDWSPNIFGSVSECRLYTKKIAT